MELKRIERQRVLALPFLQRARSFPPLKLYVAARLHTHGGYKPGLIEQRWQNRFIVCDRCRAFALTDLICGLLCTSVSRVVPRAFLGQGFAAKFKLVSW